MQQTTLELISSQYLLCKSSFQFAEIFERGKNFLIAGPIRVNEWCNFPDSVTNINKIEKRNNRPTMTGFKFSCLKETISKPEIKIKMLLVRTNCYKGICPGLESGLASIATFAKNKKRMRGNYCACMIATNHWINHNDRFKNETEPIIETQKRKRKNPKTGKKEKEKAEHQHWDCRWQYK